MPLTGQDAIESVSQAMFLTVQAMGTAEGDLIQNSGLYRDEAHMDRGSNPYVVTGTTGALVTGRFEPMSVRWVGPRATGDQVQIQDTSGNVLWHSIARQGLPEADPSVQGEFWSNPAVAVMDSGTLYILYRQFGRTS